MPLRRPFAKLVTKRSREKVIFKKMLIAAYSNSYIQPVHPKGDQSWVFIRRTDVEAETPILWPPDAKTFDLDLVPGAQNSNTFSFWI